MDIFAFKISSDVWIHIGSFLYLSEVIKLSLTSKTLHLYIHNPFSLRELCKQHESIVSALLPWYPLDSDININKVKDLIKIIDSMSKLNKLNWKPCDLLHDESEDNENLDQSDELLESEGHSCLSLYQGRRLVIIGGWGPLANHVSLYDTTNLPSLSSIRITSRDVPVFRYGFTSVLLPSTQLHSQRIIIFGGCTNGGYSGDINELLYLDLLDAKTEQPITIDSVDVIALFSCAITPNISFNVANLPIVSGSTSSIAVNLLPLQLPVTIPTTRGYHSCNLIKYSNRDCLIIFGGLSERHPTTSLEIYDIYRNTWHVGVTQGVEPSSRFGHSCTYHKRSDSLIISGGSDGSDLLRNGRELYDIHVLSILRDVYGDGKDILIWSQPALSFPGTWKYLPGRCHSSALVGDKLILFGGGATQSNATHILTLKFAHVKHILQSNDGKGRRASNLEDDDSHNDLTPDDLNEDNMKIMSNRVHEYSCLGVNNIEHQTIKMLGNDFLNARVSHVMSQIGHFIFVQGGWNNSYHILDDAWVMDLSFGNSNECFELLLSSETSLSYCERDEEDSVVVNDSDPFVYLEGDTGELLRAFLRNHYNSIYDDELEVNDQDDDQNDENDDEDENNDEDDDENDDEDKDENDDDNQRESDNEEEGENSNENHNDENDDGRDDDGNNGDAYGSGERDNDNGVGGRYNGGNNGGHNEGNGGYDDSNNHDNNRDDGYANGSGETCNGNDRGSNSGDNGGNNEGEGGNNHDNNGDDGDVNGSGESSNHNENGGSNGGNNEGDEGGNDDSNNHDNNRDDGDANGSGETCNGNGNDGGNNGGDNGGINERNDDNNNHDNNRDEGNDEKNSEDPDDTNDDVNDNDDNNNDNESNVCNDLNSLIPASNSDGIVSLINDGKPGETVNESIQTSINDNSLDFNHNAAVIVSTDYQGRGSVTINDYESVQTTSTPVDSSACIDLSLSRSNLFGKRSNKLKLSRNIVLSATSSLNATPSLNQDQLHHVDSDIVIPVSAMISENDLHEDKRIGTQSLSDVTTDRGIDRSEEIYVDAKSQDKNPVEYNHDMITHIGNAISSSRDINTDMYNQSNMYMDDKINLRDIVNDDHHIQIYIDKYIDKYLDRFLDNCIDNYIKRRREKVYHNDKKESDTEVIKKEALNQSTSQVTSEKKEDMNKDASWVYSFYQSFVEIVHEATGIILDDNVSVTPSKLTDENNVDDDEEVYGDRIADEKVDVIDNTQYSDDDSDYQDEVQFLHDDTSYEKYKEDFGNDDEEEDNDDGLDKPDDEEDERYYSDYDSEGEEDNDDIDKLMSSYFPINLR